MVGLIAGKRQRAPIFNEPSRSNNMQKSITFHRRDSWKLSKSSDSMSRA